MKTQLLYLDPHDDAASTREKLRWVQADRVVLVWPSHGRVLQRRVDLALLTREASRQAAQLGILSHDPDVRAHARALRLPLFDDLDSILPEAWPAIRTGPAVLPTRGVRATPKLVRPPRPTAGSRRRWDDARRAAWMSVVILALLALSIVVGPAAVIELTPRALEAQTEILIAMATEPMDDERTVWIPARRLQVQVGGELRQLTQGSVSADTDVASGVALFTNTQETEVVVPEGTGLWTLGTEAVRFETTEDALVPAGAGSEVLVPIRAGEAGDEGNVPAEAIGAIEGVLGLSLGVTNPEPTAGGVTALQPGVTPADLTRAQDALRLQLLQDANARLLDMLDDGEAIAPESVKVARVVSSEHRPDVGEASESILAELEVVVEALAFNNDRLIEEGLTALRGAAEAGETILPTSIRVDLLPSPGRTTPETGFYRATVSGLSFSSLDDPYLTGPLAGRDVDEATEILAGQAEWESPPVIRTWPRWWPRLPLLPWRIQLAWAPASR